ncbi:hypothetical protein NMG60_11022775 [Bertholletia excelsa]
MAEQPAATPTSPMQKPQASRSRDLSAHGSNAPSPVRPSQLRPPPARKPVPALPQSYRLQHPRKSHRRCCCSGGTCCCYTFLVLIILFILLGVTACFFVLWYSPEVPVFNLLSLHFRRFNVTDGPDGSTLSAQALIAVEVRNPNNNLRLNYGTTELDLSTDGVDLGQGRVPPFMQGRKNTTVLRITVETKDLLLESGKARRLQSGFATKSLLLQADIWTGIGLGIQDWRTWKAAVEVRCSDIRMKQVERGVVPKCKLKLFKWYAMNFLFLIF